jgi:hypothetical protein
LKLGISRVVGPGTDGEFDADGFLTHWQEYVNNGVLSPTAQLSIRSIQPKDDSASFQPNQVVVKVYLNRHLVYARLPPAAQWGEYVHCIDIETRWLKFARRVPNGTPNCDAAQGDTSACGSNEIAFVVEADPTLLTVDIIGVGPLSFKAMAPIVLVHGIRATADWFPDNGFTGPLFEARAPYAGAREGDSAGMTLGSISQTGDRLKQVIPPLAREFGATKVHLVAHSKGGLWSRQFLTQPGPYSSDLDAPPGPNNFGVLSLTTLDTPHNGSVLADYGVSIVDSDFVQGLITLGGLVINDVRGQVDEFMDQIHDLGREGTAAFNLSAPVPPTRFKDVDGTVFPTEYLFVAADANIGDKTNAIGQRVLDIGDITGLDFLPPAYPVNVGIAQTMYDLNGGANVFNGTLYNGILQIPQFGPSAFLLNDVVVTQVSALYVPSGMTVYWILDPLRKNHSTVGDRCVAAGRPEHCTTPGTQAAIGWQGVLGAIRQIQPVN